MASDVVQPIEVVVPGASDSRRRWKLPSGMRGVDFLFGSWTGLVFIFLYAPIFLLVIYSFNSSTLLIRWEGFTFKWYSVMAHNATLVKALYNSLFVAVFTTVLSTVLGTAGAWLLYRYRFPWMRLINTLVFVPMIIPEIIMGISLLMFFTLTGKLWESHVGPPLSVHLPEWLQHMGMDSRLQVFPLDLGYATIIISHVTFCFPFVMIAVQARLAGIDPALEEAAMDLGATPLKAFWKVIVPYLLPAIISGALMSFTLSMDELIVTYFTTGPGTQTLPLKVFGMVKVGLNPSLNAISTIFILGTAVLVLVAEWLKKWNK